jgi:hypothetical protein
VRANLEAELTKAAFGADMHSLVDRFVKVVLERKAEIERNTMPVQQCQ